MPSQTITIITRRQLDIYMNPQRQRLLKALRIQGAPMTSKQLSDVLGISPSSVAHHIKKLLELGILELDHTESIHGIQAKYYRCLPVSVSLGGNQDDDLKEERSLLSDYIMSETWKSFKENLRYTVPGQTTDDFIAETGDATNGVVHLKTEDALRLYHMILDFIEKHEEPGEDTVPWEYMLVAFPHNRQSSDREKGE